MGNAAIFDGDGLLIPPAYGVLSECENIIRQLNDMSEYISRKVTKANGDSPLFSCAEMEKLRYDMIRICYESIFCPERYYSDTKYWQYFWAEFFRRTDSVYFQIQHFSSAKFWEFNNNEERVIKKYEESKDLQFMLLTYEELGECDSGGNQIVRLYEDSTNMVDSMRKIVADMQPIIDYCKEEIKCLEEAARPYENLKRQTET